ncbi:hypothetical protein ACJ72_07479 [Emergomyces africanus]|uniref:Integral membrane protein n=1 Tax=Emergomyces africanus TaxID=1955775 RepID=A0A1B7NN43_9EURO|nr:hypothetical protein ACJ72_07479 [Emergomyces africanus]
MRLVIAGGSRTIVAAATVGITTTRPAGTRRLDNRTCQRHIHICGLKGGRRRREWREYSTTTACSSPSPRSHDPTSLGQIPSTPPPPPPPPLSSLSSASANPKELGGIDMPQLTHASSQLGSINIDSNDSGDNAATSFAPTTPSYPSRDIKQKEREQEQEQEQTSSSASAPSQVPSSPSIPAVPITAAAEPVTTSTTQSRQPSPSSSSSSSSTTSRSFRQIIKSSPIGRAADFYSRMQSRRPYWTQLWCTLLIYLCGDLSAQLFVGDGGGKDKDKGKKQQQEGVDENDENEGIMSRYDPLRTARHLTVGAVAAVPGYRWFMFLHHNFNFPSKPRFLSILTKVAINQACFTPVFNTYFFSMQSLLAGTSLTETWERLKLALPISIMNSAKLWPAVTAFMFMYVDPQFRSIFAGGIAVGWQTYLSWLNQKAARDVEAAEAQALAADAEGGLRRQGGGATATPTAAGATATATATAKVSA